MMNVYSDDIDVVEALKNIPNEFDPEKRGELVVRHRSAPLTANSPFLAW